MTPPLTGFFMKAVGLGEAHRQIEADKRAREDRADRRDFNRRRMQELEEEQHLRHLADVYDRHHGTGSPSRSVRRNQHFANGQSISSRSSRDARGAANGPPHSTGGSALDREGLPHLTRVHRDDISQDTLAEYEVPWHWDKKNKDYIIIELPFSERKLEELLRHTIRHPEQLELNKSAVRGKEEVEKIKKWRKSIEPVQAQWEPERRQERDPEQRSVRGLRDHDRGGARVPQSGAHMNARQANYVRPAPTIPASPQKFPKGPSLVSQKPDEIELPAPKMRSPIRQVQEVHSDPRYRSQSSAGAGLHSRSTGPWYPEEHTLTDDFHQASPQPHKSQHRARHSQAPIEQPPSRSASMARHRHGEPAAGNTRQLPLRSARGPVPLGRERAPSSMRGPEPRWETKPRSASIGRGERGVSVARSARQFPLLPSRGSIPLGRERAPSSVRGSESRRGFAPMAGSLFEDGGERGRRRGDTRRFA